MENTRIVDLEAVTEYQLRKGETLNDVARKFGIDPLKLAKFNYGTTDPRRIADCLIAYSGCTEQHSGDLPVAGDLAKILYLPKPLPPFTANPGETLKIRIKRPQYKGRVDIETMDVTGAPVPNAKLILRPEKKGRSPIQLQSDERGHARKDAVPAGRYSVLLEDGRPAYYWHCEEPTGGARARAGYLKLEPAIIDLAKTYTVTSVVVRRELSAEEEHLRGLRRELYSPAANLGHPAVEEQLRKDDHWPCVDNLALIAGWIDDEFQRVDVQKLCQEVLPYFLLDYCPAAVGVGYFICAIETKTDTLTVYDSAGKEKGTFRCSGHEPLSDRFGAYAQFEESNGLRTLDIMQRSYSFWKSPSAGQTVRVAAGRMVGVEEWKRWMGVVEPHLALREVPIFYLLPTGEQLRDLALKGGFPCLEGYYGEGKRIDRIHERNKGVCRQVARVYRDYVERFCKDINEAQTEDAIFALGEPKKYFSHSLDLGETQKQRNELNELKDPCYNKILYALSDKLTRLHEKMVEGLPYLRLTYKYTLDPQP